ncbi:flagellar basal-body MS-ring/collar protein FliF [Novosphingobium sp. PS1R-30]|uniref:Flagellar M-ring protein n=1 Tax=Novosphingobium anseongense TaxID=3133436 RepID=A0ABU8RWV7_9SPHN|nr:MAG: flagellar M-ring protein FliF [Novosphingobium sp.]
MSDLVPATPQGSVLAPLTDPAGGNAMSRLKTFTGQSAVKKMLPVFLGASALGAVALTYMTLAPAPQRTLYSQLDDSERASVVDALEKANIGYKINNDTGALTVNEDDLYKARMLVAQNGAVAAPESGDQMLDKLPMGASRELEGERMRSARERDMQLTIMEIDGVESVRVHLAEAEKSVFVRDNLPPTASVMVRLTRGRQLSDSQVMAIVNLVAGSVPGLTPDQVRVVDQHGRLLSDKTSKADSDRLELQTRMEEKLRTQVSALLAPMLGEGNFSSEIQVELDMDQVTSARESYDKQGVVRSETEQQSQTSTAQAAAGIPGVLSNTPPPPTTAQAAPPQGTPTPAPGAPTPQSSDSSTTRNYELGREVAVANTTPGKLKRISVAVALSAKAMKNGKAADVDQIKQLVSAAVGADPARGDQVAVITRSFESIPDVETPFYEAPWFATVVRNVVALIAVLLVLLLGVRPLIKALKREPAAGGANGGAAGAGGEAAEGNAELAEAEPIPAALPAEAMIDAETGVVDAELLSQQVGLAQRIVAEKPESAVVALRQMLNQPAPEAVAQ